MATLIADDGVQIGWETVGAGCVGVVVVHGGMRMGKHYRELARLAGERFTFHLVDRRGRGASPAPSPLHVADIDGRAALAREIADLRAVLERTGARCVLGHSAGGLIALEAARVLSRGPAPLIEKLAVYEPAVSIRGSLPTSWAPDFEKALAAGDDARAFAVVAKGLDVGPPAWLPPWLLALPLRVLFRSDDGREMAALLPTLVRDLAIGTSADAADASRFADIACPALVLSGDKSPRYLVDAAAAIAAAIPGARLVAGIPDAGHNAPDLQPALIVAALAAFFS